MTMSMKEDIVTLLDEFVDDAAPIYRGAFSLAVDHLLTKYRVELKVTPASYNDLTNYRDAQLFVCSCGDTVKDRLKHDMKKHPERSLTVYSPLSAAEEAR